MSDCISLEMIDFNKDLDLSKEQIREFISNVEELAKTGLPIDIPLRHEFSRGVYAREIKIPKGALIVGKIHKHQNMNILSAGEATVVSIDGIERVKAPYMFVSNPGAKRVIYAHEDTVWTTIHGTHETDLEKLEEEFIAKNYDEVIEHKEALCLG